MKFKFEAGMRDLEFAYEFAIENTAVSVFPASNANGL